MTIKTNVNLSLNSPRGYLVLSDGTKIFLILKQQLVYAYKLADENTNEDIIKFIREKGYEKGNKNLINTAIELLNSRFK